LEIAQFVTKMSKWRNLVFFAIVSMLFINSVLHIGCAKITGFYKIWMLINLSSYFCTFTFLLLWRGWKMVKNKKIVIHEEELIHLFLIIIIDSIFIITSSSLLLHLFHAPHRSSLSSSLLINFIIIFFILLNIIFFFTIPTKSQ